MMQPWIYSARLIINNRIGRLAGKLARAVLWGPGGSNVFRLPDLIGVNVSDSVTG